MRVHKYRVFDKTHNVMHYPYDGTQVSVYWNKMSGPAVYQRLEDFECCDGHRDKNSVKMEWIGLKDKNGKDIYEGDLLFAFGSIIGVIYHNGAFGYIASRHTGFIPFCGNQYLQWNSGKCDKVEVAGNICENPELLK